MKEIDMKYVYLLTALCMGLGLQGAQYTGLTVATFSLLNPKTWCKCGKRVTQQPITTVSPAIVHKQAAATAAVSNNSVTVANNSSASLCGEVTPDSTLAARNAKFATQLAEIEKMKKKLAQERQQNAEAGLIALSPVPASSSYSAATVMTFEGFLALSKTATPIGQYMTDGESTAAVITSASALSQNAEEKVYTPLEAAQYVANRRGKGEADQHPAAAAAYAPKNVKGYVRYPHHPDTPHTFSYGSGDGYPCHICRPADLNFDRLGTKP